MKNDRNPFDQIDLVRRVGFGAATLPVADGGQGLNVRELLRAVIELAGADSYVPHILRSHFWQVNRILRWTSGSERARWIDQIRAGKIFGNANTEKGARPVGAPVWATRVSPDGDNYRVSGEKFYSTGTLFADWITVSCQFDDDTLSEIVVPADRAGVQIIDDWDGIGQSRTGSGTTILDNVLVYPHEVLHLSAVTADPPAGSVDDTFVQLYLQALIAGVLRSVVADSIGLIGSRARSFSHATTEKPSDDPVLHEVVGRIASTAFVAEASVLTAADLVDEAYSAEARGDASVEAYRRAALAAAHVKVHVDAAALSAATNLFEVGGASAASRDKNLDRHWRNIRTISLHNPIAYKAVQVGNTLINGEALPTNGYF
nr:acyl-CoA dehydrogenase family protein [Rhodococcus sp. 06-621-2]